MKSMHVTYPVVWADIELPEIAPAPDNGWNSVYTSPCSGAVKQSSVPAAVDRAEFNGFATYITAHSKYKVGVYSSPAIWAADLRHRATCADPEHLRVDLLAGDLAPVGQAAVGWCLRGSVDVRAVLRRADIVEQVRPDVAVVGRRRRHATASATSTRSTSPA